MIYVMIFSLRIFSVSLGTVRLVLMQRGQRLIASMTAAVEIATWLYVTGSVLMGISEDPLKAVVYVAGGVAGIYLGLVLENKLAIGYAQIEVIASVDEAKTIAGKLRDGGYRLTSYECEGLEGEKTTLIMKVQRKDVPTTVDLLKEYEHLFITITDIRRVTAGSIIRQSFIKH